MATITQEWKFDTLEEMEHVSRILLGETVARRRLTACCKPVLYVTFKNERVVMAVRKHVGLSCVGQIDDAMGELK